jgi:hypothetical protein
MSQIQKTKKQELSTAIDFSFGAENILTQDIRLPKILLMQQMSDFVGEKKAQAGDLVESFEVRKLGDDKSPVQVIPFYFTNTWTVKQKEGNKFVFLRSEPREGTDIQREFEQETSEGTIRNYRTLNVFCLLKGGNSTVPFLISFTSTSFSSAAQPFLNKAQLLRAEGKAPAHILYNIGSKYVDDKDSGNKYYVFTCEAAKDKDGKDILNTNEEVTAAYQAYQSMTNQLKQGAKIDMSTEEAPF